MSSTVHTEAKRRIAKALKTNDLSLDLSNLGLTDVPSEIRQLTHINRLDLSQNKLTSVPPELGQLTQLTILSLYQNQLTSVPPELGQLTQLTILSLYQNQLTSVPPELGQLSNLSRLYLYQNQLTNVPPELGQLTQLTRLYLSQNQLTNVPPQLGNLIGLKWLSLHQNRLTGVPPELGQLIDLPELSLHQNLLTDVPPELGQLTNLSRLDLSQNKLTDVPSELGQLANLSWLDLSQNKLTDVPPELGQLANLSRLDLSQNKLTDVPSELGQLANLSRLDLSQNRLGNLSTQLFQLAKLTELYLDQNQLTSLPPELWQLDSLLVLDLDQNPDLSSPPPEVLKQGTQAILTYLREQHTENQPQWLSKLLIVGEGGVGKTSLLRALMDEPFQSEQATTHGIEIKPLPLAHPAEINVNMTLNTWDFGGQEIYHATHQFFLTNRSLFLLVFNARIGFEQSKLIYWLKTIRANAPESPIVLVATYTDERDADLPFTDIKEQFPKIAAFHEVSNKTGKGIHSLKTTIAQTAADLPLMGESWPVTWLKFANSLRGDTKKEITPRRFFMQMTKAGISDASKSVLANWLHELGDILFFQEDVSINDLVILKPQWVTEYISRVLEAKEVIASNGIFTKQCMEEIWHDLDPDIRKFFLRLMERFDLSYRTLGNLDISLVVERLPFEQPNFQERWDAKKQEANCKEISMKFQLSEMLPGIPTWFIARQHRFTIEQGERRGIHWRTGVLFQDRGQKHLALVRTLRDEITNVNHLHLTVRGPIPHNFFDVLREGLELTLRRYPGLNITRLLPCPDPNRINCQHEFDYANLTKRLERTPPKDTIECHNCLENISVTRLLFGLHYTTQSAVAEKIDNLQDSMNEGLKVPLQHIKELSAIIQRDVLREIRAIQKSLEFPCPTLFVLRPDGRSLYDFGKLTDKRLKLQLYCEHPGCFHPVEKGGLYTVENPQEWVCNMSPHIRRIANIIKYVTPITGPWVTVPVADYAELIKNDLSFTNDLVKSLPEISPTDDTKGFIDRDGQNRQAQRASGSNLRALHEFLKEKDKERNWGNLSRVKTPEGDVLWLCEHHKKEFYPDSSRIQGIFSSRTLRTSSRR
ncbi:MAG: COR domain-containing protein [Cyanobacteria bacterium J06627_32]